MDKTIEQLFKVFTHLAREIQVYVFTGFIVLADLYLIDYFYYSGSLWKHFNSNNYSILIGIISSYIIGQICLGFYNASLEFWEFDLKLYKLFFKKRFIDIVDASDEAVIGDKIKIFAKLREPYFHFVERDVNLSAMRWNFSSAFFIIFLSDLVYCLFIKYYWQVALVFMISFISCWCLLTLSIYTQKENAQNIKELKKLI